ncbi:MAG TPA: 4-phosphoerythronate dehydrogenase PdxB [Paludibacter sp.]|nr:4-phosphoerythronate dehydrogenase PdxB [Paludibacter sp.]
MKIIIDDKIPYIHGAFEGMAEVVYLPGAKTTPEVVKDADAIVTRTRTICNEKLLAGSAVKFIATATIGYDHIDTEYCDTAGIKWTNAPGCNSKSVEQYVASALMVLAERRKLQLKDLCIGVVGVGNVGDKVARFCDLLGMKVLLNDPPRERTEGAEAFVSLQQIMEQADIISLHVPLNMKGEDATFQLVNEVFLSSLKKRPILINSCRGEVIETNAIKAALKSGQISRFVCDCWENEPDIDLELLALTEIATPHIAGYSKDGKATGTLMSVRAISDFFGLGLNNWQPSGVELPTNPIIEIDGAGLNEQEIISKTILATYDIRTDDILFRNNAAEFEQQRGDYPTRREFPAFTIQAKNVNRYTLEKLKKMGFVIH